MNELISKIKIQQWNIANELICLQHNSFIRNEITLLVGNKVWDRVWSKVKHKVYEKVKEETK